MPQQVEPHPLKIVGGNKFGRYPKISIEQTFNMIVSDDALVPYAGYAAVINTSSTEPGRGIYESSINNIMMSVLGSEVKKTVANLTTTTVGNLATTSGPVYITENNNNEIALTDGVNIYIYDVTSNAFKQSGVDFALPPGLVSPGYISFQNGRFLAVNSSSTNWYLSDFNNGTTWPNDAQHVGAIQTKPDHAQAAIPVPGGGNNLLVLGRIVSELWQDVGNALFPYARNTTFNIDYGCLNPSSIAYMDNYIVWLCANDKAGPVVMVFQNNHIEAISTDGIDYKLANLSNPSNCIGFLFRQDGHLIYQFTFPDDNLSYIFDFNTKMFFTVTDENMNYHIARQVAFFNNAYYFVSLNAGNIYEFSTKYSFYEYSPIFVKEIPRIRITHPIRSPDQDRFVMRSLGFTIENGRPNTITVFTDAVDEGDLLATEDLDIICCENGDQLTIEADDTVVNTYTYSSGAIDLAISIDGGENFGSNVRKDMNPVGKRRSRLIWQRLGSANDATFKIQFWGFERFVAFDGIVEVYK